MEDEEIISINTKYNPVLEDKAFAEIAKAVRKTKRNAHGLLGKLCNNLREIWVEIPGDCHLNCSYCFAYENKRDFEFRKVEGDVVRTDKRECLLSLDEILSNIKQFDEDFPLSEEERREGIEKRLAIPAAGEPFVNEKMKTYVYGILDECQKRGIVATVFTTGDKITEQDMERLDKYGHNLRLFVKYNSAKPEIQDKFVGRKGYTEAREKVLNNLIKRGFNDGRLGIVTSVMIANAGEISDLLVFARENNLEFDADTILERGRGSQCRHKFNEGENKQILETLERLRKLDKEKYGNEWKTIPTYVGSDPCTRFDHHVYIKGNGDVSPCVGAPQIVYGNTRTGSLKELWDGKVAQIIRAHEIVGACAGCKNYQDKTCYSCLARSTDNLNQEELLKAGEIKTIGCMICGPKK